MRKLSLLTFAIAAILLSSATSASAVAVDRWASVPGGGNVASCIESAPCSLTDALNGSYYGPGSTIHVLPGTYPVPAGLTINQAITVDGGNAGDTVFHVTDSVSYALYLAANATISDITIDAVHTGFGVGTQFGSSPTLSRVIVKNGGGHACTGDLITIVDSICQATDQYAVGFWANNSGGSLQLTMRNATVIGGSSANAMFLGIGNGTYTANVTNTIFKSGVAQPLFLIASSPGGNPGVLNFNIDHSSFADAHTEFSGSAVLNETVNDPSNQNSEPLLDADFKELAGSPTINAGSSLGASPKDLAGLVRNQGTAPDIGAYEFPEAPVVVPPVDGGSGGSKTALPTPDITKPTITISKKPKSKTTSKKLKVTFKASEAATFQCKLDKGKFRTCRSPYKKTVKIGKHKLQIKATDAAGNVSTVKTIKWTVK